MVSMCSNTHYKVRGVLESSNDSMLPCTEIGCTIVICMVIYYYFTMQFQFGTGISIHHGLYYACVTGMCLSLCLWMLDPIAWFGIANFGSSPISLAVSLDLWIQNPGYSTILQHSVLRKIHPKLGSSTNPTHSGTKPYDPNQSGSEKYSKCKEHSMLTISL